MGCLKIELYFLYILLFLFPFSFYLVIDKPHNNSDFRRIDILSQLVGHQKSRIFFFLIFIILWILPYFLFDFCDLKEIDNNSTKKFFW